jgi:acetylornithine deacetylase/succinyl-diaminopimelate desuccinylase-like protein
VPEGGAVPLDPVETLQRLIQIPSVNPLVAGGDATIRGESRLTDFLQETCQQLGWGWLRQRVHPGRENLLALVPGKTPARDGGELLLWDVHQDTVAVDGMTVKPFGGEIRDGRVYGRGASDVKGSMAVMLAALSSLNSNEPESRQANVVLAFTVNEECGHTGAQALAHLWAPVGTSYAASGDIGIASGSITPVNLFPRPPDAILVAEPTQLNPVVAHQGMVRWRCHTEGRAAHSSRPEDGVNAIYAMTRVVQAIERYHVELDTSAAEHPRCGRPSVCVSTIQGGVGVNTVPDRATIEIDRRISPGSDPVAAYEELIRYIGAHAETGEARISHDPPFMQSSGLSDAGNGRLANRLVEVVTARGRSASLVGAPYGTDAASLAASGVPTVVFGPGSISQAHTADESIEIAELQLATDVFYEIATRGLR